MYFKIKWPLCLHSCVFVAEPKNLRPDLTSGEKFFLTEDQTWWPLGLTGEERLVSAPILLLHITFTTGQICLPSTFNTA